MADVIVVGAGPVGLMLAGELRLGGADVVVCERLDGPSGESRGVGFTRRTAEVFDQRGVLERLGEIEVGNQGHFGGVFIDFSALDDNHFGIRGVPQYRVEAVLEAWLAELGTTVRRGHEVVGLRETGDDVTAIVDGPAGREELTARYLVGCDGGRSTVRRLAGIGFPGHAATRGMYVADVVGQDIRPRPVGERVKGGMILAIRLEDGVDRIIIHPDVLAPREDPNDLTFDEIADSWQSITGQSIHGAECRWMSTFTDASRQAEVYRRGRVLLVGDSAHIHIPAGAQGLSVGVQDAVNLGWKLAATVCGRAPRNLLDTYQSERYPVGGRLLRSTRAQALLYLSGDEMEPLRSVMRELAALPEAARALAGMVSGLEVRYDMGVTATNPLVGLRMRDHGLELAGGRRTRVADLLHPARGVLIRTGGPAVPITLDEAAAPWADRVDVVVGRWVPTESSPVPEGLDAVLIRPDGHVAWAAPGGGDLEMSLNRWFGAPRVAAAAPAGHLASGAE